MSEKSEVAIFSDGACRGNPGPGSWGMVGQNHEGDVIFKGSGVETRTTNNRMEMMGAIEAFKAILNEEFSADETTVLLYSDSKYVVDGLKSWMKGWKKRGWKKADKKTPENVDLWQELDEVVQNFKNVKYFWVKGHAGHPQNELCDQLANEALDDSGF
ncbi:ribonuclease HI [Halobacteriovorax marinus]|uniref:Ribonuclease H n=1 Tax=Halobacteriovorax marinus TaxID=97084 RepID=A0A1Y5FA79_9BACT|nr:ribonuclease HI [Halobacteriovorax marinus]